MRAAKAATLICVAAAAAAVAGCVPGRGGGPADGSPSAGIEDVATDAQGVERCAPAADGVVQAINEALTGRNNISNAWTVRSRQYDMVYFTSARVGDGEQTATWATLAPEGGQFLFAVTELAQGVGDFPVDPSFTGGDDGVRESQRCARVR